MAGKSQLPPLIDIAAAPDPIADDSETAVEQRFYKERSFASIWVVQLQGAKKLNAQRQLPCGPPPAAIEITVCTIGRPVFMASLAS